MAVTGLRVRVPENRVTPGSRPGQWLIIHGRLLGKALAPLGAVTVVVFLEPGLQQLQPAGWRSRL